MDWSELEQFLKEEAAGTGKELSFTELVQALIEGRGKDAGRMILDGLRESFLGEMENGGAMAVQLLTLGLLGAVFSGFSEIFSGDQMSEAGFFVIYLMTFTVMAAFFLESADTAVGTGDGAPLCRRNKNLRDGKTPAGDSRNRSRSGSCDKAGFRLRGSD